MEVLSSLLVVLTLVWADAPTVEISTLDGKQISGELVNADPKTWKIKQNGRDAALPVADILAISLPAVQTEPAPGLEVILSDGSRIGAAQVLLDKNEFKFDSPNLGERKLSRSAVAHVRFAAAPSPVDAAWQELTQRERRQDLLVIRKDDVLDFVEGVIGQITAGEVQILLDGEPVTVKRDKVFGIVCFQRSAAAAKAVARLDMANGDRILLQNVTAANGQIQVDTVAAGEATIPLGRVRRIDFSLGRLTWLADLSPREIKHEYVFIDVLPEYQSDRDIDGGRLRIGDRTFDRGVCIRSKTLVRYRLDGDYRRFEAWMGIQKGYQGDVRVEVSVDGVKQLESEVSPEAKEPQRVEVNVAGKYTLEVLVDYGAKQNDIGDHLILGDARLIK